MVQLLILTLGVVSLVVFCHPGGYLVVSVFFLLSLLPTFVTLKTEIGRENIIWKQWWNEARSHPTLGSWDYAPFPRELALPGPLQHKSSKRVNHRALVLNPNWKGCFKTASPGHLWKPQMKLSFAVESQCPYNQLREISEQTVILQNDWGDSISSCSSPFCHISVQATLKESTS